MQATAATYLLLYRMMYYLYKWNIIFLSSVRPFFETYLLVVLKWLLQILLIFDGIQPDSLLCHEQLLSKLVVWPDQSET